MTVPIKQATSDETVEGVFTGYAAVFDNVDSYGDVMRKGAFAESLAERGEKGAGIPCYWSHQMADPDMCIGETVEAREDDHGLFVKVQLDLDSPKGGQVYRLIKAGRVNQMSFAFDIEDYAFAHDDELGDYCELRKVKLHEVSVVQVGANQETELLDVKHSLGRVKAGRALSAKNEDKLREVTRLVEEVLADLDSDDSGAKAADTNAGDEPDDGGNPDGPAVRAIKTGGHPSLALARTTLNALEGAME